MCYFYTYNSENPGFGIAKMLPAIWFLPFKPTQREDKAANQRCICTLHSQDLFDLTNLSLVLSLLWSVLSTTSYHCLLFETEPTMSSTEPPKEETGIITEAAAPADVAKEEPDAPTPMEQADYDDIANAVNEAAKEVADAAAADMDTTEAENETKDADKPNEDAKVEEKPADESKDDAKVEEATTEADEAKVEDKPADASKDADPASTTKAKDKPKKDTKKRIRRVGKTTPRKVPKLEEAATPTSMAGTPAASETPGGDASATTSGEAAEAVAAAAASLPESIPRVLSKHDEKWNGMLDKLVAFKVSSTS
jgi:hypothetical protein